MESTMTKSAIILSVWLISIPSIFSIFTSVFASIYFISMLKINVVDVKHGGSWIVFIKTTFKSIFKKKAK